MLGGKHVNLLDKKKRTPLFLAAQWNYFDICELLFNNGANPFILNIDEKRAIDVVTDPIVKKLILIQMGVSFIYLLIY